MGAWLKRAVLIGGIAALGGAGAGCYSAEVVTPTPAFSIGVFYDSLTPYGAWIDTPRFGRVWQPYPAIVGPDFVPYSTGGQWIYTDYGWTWDSFWDWGWAPFHYGRWFLDPVYGWVWLPGTVWAPAWVDWRFGGGYIGWAPLPPPGFALGFGAYWSFVPVHAFYYPNPVHYAVPVGGLGTPWGATHPVGRTVTYGGVRLPAGPPPDEIVRVGGRPVPSGSVNPPAPGRVEPVRPVASGPRYQPPSVAGQPGQGQQPIQGQPPTYQPPRTTAPPGATPGYRPPSTSVPAPAAPPTYHPPSISAPPPSAPPPTYQPPSTSAPPPPPPAFSPPAASAPPPPPPSFHPPAVSAPPPPPPAPPPSVHPGVPVGQAPPPPNPKGQPPETRPQGPRMAQNRAPPATGKAQPHRQADPDEGEGQQAQ